MTKAKTRMTETGRDAERGYSDADLAEVMDHPEATDAQLARLQPFAEVFPELAATIPRRRSQKSPTKQQVSLSLERDVIDHFKAGGPGWQVRMGEALKKAAGL